MARTSKGCCAGVVDATEALVVYQIIGHISFEIYHLVISVERELLIVRCFSVHKWPDDKCQMIYDQ